MFFVSVSKSSIFQFENKYISGTQIDMDTRMRTYKS